MSKIPLTIIVHTRNSSRTLEKALHSISQIASQLIVMDMESSDNSIEIAKKYNAEIYTTKNVGYTDPARNEAIQKVSQPWLFLLDADEWIESELREKIQSLIQMSDDSISAYAFPRENHIFGLIAKTGWWPDYQVRLFRNGTVRWGSKIHSKPEITGLIQQMPDEKQFAIQHDNYPTVFEFVDRLNRYTTIEAENGRSQQSPLKTFIDEYLRRYVVMDGMKQGNYGQSLAVLQGMYEAVKAIKLLEINGFSTRAHSAKELQEISDIFAYWSKTVQVQHSKGFVSRWYWKLRRKLCL